jgi:Undecaprenyl-phosphate galactose phosphotransferase WbaP
MTPTETLLPPPPALAMPEPPLVQMDYKPAPPAQSVRGSARPGTHPAVALRGTPSGWAMRGIYVISDFVAFLSSLAAAAVVVNLVRGTGLIASTAIESKLYLLWFAGLVATAAMQQTYAAIPPRPVRKFRGWVMGATTVCGVLVGAAWLLNLGSTTLFVTIFIATILAVLSASFCRAVCRILFGTASWWGTRLIVVGSGGLVARTCAELAREPQWGLRPIGFVSDSVAADETPANSLYLGTLDALDSLAVEFRVDWALVAVHSFAGEDLAEMLSRASGRVKHWIILPPLDHFPSLWLEACEAARRPALTFTNRLKSGVAPVLKRSLDLAVAVSLGIAVLPLVALIVAAIRLSSPGPIFYGQERIGRLGRRFKAWKFRTMRPNADAVLARYLEQHPALAAEWQANHKLRSDPRVTWVGRWLRSTSLDELPQVWNVIVGDMSLVGPRPIVSAEIDKYAENYEQYVQVLPGITGLWQVSGRNNTTYEERVALDVYYVQNWSLWLDVYILACTAKVVLLCEGAY